MLTFNGHAVYTTHVWKYNEQFGLKLNIKMSLHFQAAGRFFVIFRFSGRCCSYCCTTSFVVSTYLSILMDYVLGQSTRLHCQAGHWCPCVISLSRSPCADSLCSSRIVVLSVCRAASVVLPAAFSCQSGATAAGLCLSFAPQVYKENVGVFVEGWEFI